LSLESKVPHTVTHIMSRDITQTYGHKGHLYRHKTNDIHYPVAYVMSSLSVSWHGDTRTWL